MSYTNLKDMLTSARRCRYAVGAFNIVDAVTSEAVVLAAEQTRSPVIIQTSAKTVKLYGAVPLATTVKYYANRVKVPVALHLDHCKDIALINECIEAGWSSVMIDASSLPFEENVKLTKQVVELAHPRNITVEGELGAIVGVEDDIFVSDNESHLANPEQSIEFVKATGVDVFAPAIGTAHGVYKGEPKIAFDLLGKIASSVPAVIAIHGGTGLSNEVFARCISLGGAKVNISTQIKHVFRDTLAKVFAEKPDEYEPVRIMTAVRDEAQKTVANFIQIFGSVDKA